MDETFPLVEVAVGRLDKEFCFAILSGSWSLEGGAALWHSKARLMRSLSRSVVSTFEFIVNPILEYQASALNPDPYKT